MRERRSSSSIADWQRLLAASFPRHRLLQGLADEASVGNAAGFGARLDHGKQRLGQAHVDARVLPRKLEPGLNCETSYSLRSASSKKRSASSSVSKIGIFFFILRHLLPVRMAGPDAPGSAREDNDLDAE
jgi:hypothetical protein